MGVAASSDEVEGSPCTGVVFVGTADVWNPLALERADEALAQPPHPSRKTDMTDAAFSAF